MSSASTQRSSGVIRETYTFIVGSGRKSSQDYEVLVAGSRWALTLLDKQEFPVCLVMRGIPDYHPSIIISCFFCVKLFSGCGVGATDLFTMVGRELPVWRQTAKATESLAGLMSHAGGSANES